MRLLVATGKVWGRVLADLLHQHLPEAAITTATNLDEFIDRVTGEVYDLAAVELGFGGEQARVVWDLLPGTSCILLVPERRAAEIGQLAILPADDFVIYNEDTRGMATELASRLRLGHRRQHAYYSLRQRYEDVTQSLTEIIYELDSEGHFVYLNRSIELLGYTPDELLGRHFSHILDAQSVEKASRQTVLPALRGVATGASAAPGLFDERRRGRRKTVGLEVTLRPKRSDAVGALVGSVTATGEIARTIEGTQQFVGTLGVIQDITLRRRSEDSLRKLYAIAEEVPASVVVTDSSMTVEYANPQFYHSFHVAPEYVISQKLNRIPAAGFNGALSTGIERCCASGETWRATILSNEDSAVVHAVVARPVVDGRGACSGLVLVIADASSAIGLLSGYTLRNERTSTPSGADSTAPVSSIVAEALKWFQGHNSESVAMLRPRVAESIPPVSWNQAAFLQQLIRDLLSLAAGSTGEGTCSLAVGRGDEGAVQVLVRGMSERERPEAGRDPLDRARLSTMLERSEHMRRVVLACGGKWELRRSATGIEYLVTVPASVGDDVSHAGGATPDTKQEAGLYDITEFVKSYVGSEDVLREILAIYLDETPVRLEELQDALRLGDTDSIVKIAHSLANTSGALQSLAAVEAARALESAARGADLGRCRSVSEKLIPAVQAIVKAVNELDL